MNLQYAQRAYTNTMVKTSASPVDLIIMLYDGAIEHLNRAVFYINQGEISKKNQSISKVVAIIEELLSSLNMEVGGEIAKNLQALYIYMITEITRANIRNDIEKIRHIEFLLKEIRSAWRQIR